jgi:osmoprotectant transport system substrate-binding protein
MSGRRIRGRAALALLATATLALGGCAGRYTGGGEGPLEGAEIAFGSKDFTEQKILGQISVQYLRSKGADVWDQTGLVSSQAVRDSLLRGDIDAYWEYTGTGWITHLGHTEPIADSRKQYDAVAEEDLAKNQIQWLQPAPADNSFAIAVRSEAAGVLGVTNLSSLAVLATLRPEDTTLCAASEFLTRDDGLPGMERAYNFQSPNDNIVKTQEGQIYRAVDEGDKCNFGEVFVTDGRVRAFDLEILEDDKQFFPIYNPSLTVREEVMNEYPGISDVFAPISEKLDNETLQELNAAVDVDRESAEDVARQFLRENGLL